MTPIDQPVLTVRSIADLIAVVPYLFSFHPTDSIVLVGMRDRQVAFAARRDLPDPHGGTAAEENSEIRDTAGYLAAVIARQDVTDATIIGYGPAARVTPMVDEVRAALDRHRVTIRDALRVTDGRYWSYLCDNPRCCPPEGVPFDQESSRIAAAATFAGQVVLPDRTALAQRIAPVTGAGRLSMRQATSRAIDRLAALLATAPAHGRRDEEVVRRAGEPAVRAALDRYRDGGVLTDDEVAWLSLLLNDLGVRDYAWERTDGTDWHLALWTDVVRRAEPEQTPAPACLLAFTAWRIGQGALATLALDRALEIRPDYSMALLLADLLHRGVPPATLDGWPQLLREPRPDADRQPGRSGARRPQRRRGGRRAGPGQPMRRLPPV
jgi:hypothetical protein